GEGSEIQEDGLRVLDLGHVDLDGARPRDRERRMQQERRQGQRRMAWIALDAHRWSAGFEGRHDDDYLDGLDPESRRHQHGLRIRALRWVTLQEGDVGRASAK